MNFTVKVRKIGQDSKIPERATDGSSGYDVFAYRVLDKESKKVISDLIEPVEIKPGETALFGIGVCIEIPKTHHAIIVSRSGLSTKSRIEACHPGAPIDSDYRGEPAVLLKNDGNKSFIVSKHMRIAQMVFIQREIPFIVETEELSKTERGDRGHGSTGLY
ncbi:MAG: dUTP diphosphatase [Candidatus Nealsonbacteria bacterium]|nr:dUTP diphosphatase [Candidatus Nealsonbacteria bacterium]